MKNDLKNINWVKLGYGSLLLLSIFGINFLTLNNSILSDLGQAGKNILSHLGFMPFIFVISLAIIAFDLVRNISWKFVGKLSLGYVIYLIVAYFLLITRNLNNEKFKLWDFAGNDFWQVEFLPILIPLVISAFLIKALFDYLKPKRLRGELLKDCQTSNLLLAGLLASVAVNDGHYSDILRDGLKNFIINKQFSEYLSNFNFAFFLSMAGLILVSYFVIRAGKDLIENRPSLSLAVMSSVFFALIFNYSLQFGVKGDSDLLGRYIFPGATLYQILVLTAVFFLIYVLINHYVPTTLIIIIIGTLISVANVLKDSMRSEPLLVTDFVWLREINLLLSFLDGWMIFYIILAFLLPIIIYLIFRNHVLVGKIIKQKRIRLSFLVLLLIFFSSIFFIFRNEEDGKVAKDVPVISKLNNWQNITWMGFGTNARYRSLMFVWTKQLTKSVMEKPGDYSEKTINKLAEKYQKDAAVINKTRSQNLSDQTIIYVLSESLANPNRVSGVNLTKNILPSIEWLKTGTTSGLMKSDGYGGGTANMEFQTLTGLPFYNFSNSVATLYSEVVPNMSVFPSISDSFNSKNRIVMHPAGATNYNRYTVYKKLNFNKLYFLNGSKDKFKHIDRQGVSVSDETVYNNILENIDTSQSQFFSVITMQNHAPWSVGNPVDVKATGQGFTAKENDNLTEYSRLISHTDQSTRAFMSALSKINKKITVVFYGDHLPGIYPDSAFSKNSATRFQTDYFIWSNWQKKKLNYPLVNSSDFTAEMLKHTNSKVTPYQALLTEVLDKASVSSKISTKEQKEIAHDLRLLQYDVTVGKGYIKSHKDFFTVPNEKK